MHLVSSRGRSAQAQAAQPLHDTDFNYEVGKCGHPFFLNSIHTLHVWMGHVSDDEKGQRALTRVVPADS